MTSAFESYQAAKTPLPEKNLAWNLYGAGYKNLGRGGKPEVFPIPIPNPDQILVRIDSVGICYSDVKLLQQGGDHPKLAGIDLARHPTRPGHEISFTVVKVGRSLRDKFSIGQRFAIQPEVQHNGVKHTYGFSIPGGLAQYQTIGSEILDTDQGQNLIYIDKEFGYAEASLLEPFGSVLSSYDQTRRLTPKPGGKMWIEGNAQDLSKYSLSKYTDHPSLILITNGNRALKGRPHNSIIRNNISIQDYKQINQEFTAGAGFDDIIILESQSTQQIEALFELIAPGGLLNLVGSQPLKQKANIRAARIHYDYVSVVGNSSKDISASYGHGRNRSNLTPNGTAVFFGGAGPMGQMHLLHAITMANGPASVLVVDTNQNRLSALRERFLSIAHSHNTALHLVTPQTLNIDLQEWICANLSSLVIDDAVVLVPLGDVISQAFTLLSPTGLMNLFAGTKADVTIQVDLSPVYLDALQIMGASGLTIDRQKQAYQLARQGQLDINASVAAVGGMNVAAEAIRAAEDRQFPGKIVIYPQLVHLPLMSILDIGGNFPQIQSKLKMGNTWTKEAEQVLLNSKLPSF